MLTASAWSTPLRYSKWRMGGSVVEERVEDEGFPLALGGSGRLVASKGRIEHGSPIWLCVGLGLAPRRGGRLRRSGRGQIKPAFAPAARKRQRHGDQNRRDPSRRRRTGSAIHGDIPKCGGTIQRLPQSGETRAG